MSKLRFGANSPVKGLTEASAPRMCFGELQEKAKAMLNTSGGSALPGEGVVINSSSAQLLQFIEEFCREGDRVVDENKRDKVDLQKQVRRWKVGENACIPLGSQLDVNQSLRRRSLRGMVNLWFALIQNCKFIYYVSSLCISNPPL